MSKTVKKIIKITAVTIFALFVFFVLWFMSGEGVDKPENITWGVTFSPKQAKDLGLDWKKVYLELLDDMKVGNFRLSAPWDSSEAKKTEYDFSDIDWMIEEAQKRDAKIILAVGRKLFRWPECHDPEWILEMNKNEIEGETLIFLEKSILHFKKYDNIVAWQVENEPGFPFGECHFGAPSKELFKREISLVRSLDATRPVLSTDSGELSSWLGFGSQVDMLGVSLYRVTENPIFGRFYYPMRPGFYQKKAALAMAINKNIQKIYISELQLEPWSMSHLLDMSLKEQFESMSFSRAQSIIEYASRTGFDEIYLWGVEWWYWLKENHKDARFWGMGKSLVLSSKK